MTSRLRAGVAACLCLWTAAALAADQPRTVALFNGKDLSGWKTVGGRGVDQWRVGKAALDPVDPTRLIVAGAGEDLVSPRRGANLVSTASFGDCIVQLEFMVSKHSNSGVKLMRIYEIQILDSYGKSQVGKQDCGAVYDENAPLINATRKPGQWQTLWIDFRAPRFDASGKKIANARFVKVVLNGRVVQKNVEIAHGTNVSRYAPEHPTGPIYLQGDHGPVAFRNFRITPLN
jgi:3-keto-disaccharide hydrolase